MFTVYFWQWLGFLAVSVLGTLLHFLYDKTGSPVAALFSGVNESTWEHMKLLFFPMFLFAIVQSFFLGQLYDNFWCIKLRGTLLGLAMIPVIFYSLRGIFGSTPDWINIGIFFVSAAVAYSYEARKFCGENVTCTFPTAGFWGFLLLTAAFWIFTFLPPTLPLFQDPVDGHYGVKR